MGTEVRDRDGLSLAAPAVTLISVMAEAPASRFSPRVDVVLGGSSLALQFPQEVHVRQFDVSLFF